MNTGIKIRKFRLENKWTQSVLAEKVGLPVNRIQQYETDFRTPKSDLLLQFAKVFNVPVSKLFSVNINNFEEAEEVLNDIVFEFGMEFVLECLNRMEQLNG